MNLKTNKWLLKALKNKRVSMMEMKLPNHEFKPQFKDFADCFDFSFLVPHFDYVFSIHEKAVT